jgi:hypothetical protein
MPKGPQGELQLDLSGEESDRIINFLGFGRPSAPVWFIGLEEGLGKADSKEAVDNLKARTSFRPVMDLCEAHKGLQEKGGFIDIESKAAFTQVWIWMAKIVRAHNGCKDWSDAASAREYVQLKLGRNGGETFLTELSPIPSANAKDKKWMDWFLKKDSELTSKIEQRREELKKLLNDNNPPLVVCYGSKSADEFADLLDLEWQPVYGGIFTSRDSRRLLLPFFGNGHMSHCHVETLIDRRLLGPSQR